MKATARPSPSAITHALVPPDQVRGRLRRPASGPAPHAHLAPCCWPPFFRARRLVVSPDAGAVQKRHPELNPTLLGQEQQPLPHAQVGPADEHLSRPRPGTQFSRDGAPLGSILMPPENGRNRAPQILGRGLALGPARLNQRLQPPPLCVRQHRSSSPGKVTWEGHLGRSPGKVTWEGHLGRSPGKVTLQRHRGRSPWKVTWEGHLGRSPGKVTWEGHLGRSPGKVTWEGHLGRSPGKVTWEGHLGRSPGKVTWEGHL